MVEASTCSCIVVGSARWAGLRWSSPLRPSCWRVPTSAFPLLLTSRDALHSDAAAALDELAIEHVLIPGGTAAVS